VTERQSVPLTNIVMPVFNRYDETLITILAVRRMTRRRVVLTVVDNGSDDALRGELNRLADEKVIDNLFLLERNYGIAPACNLGWRLVDAPFFMKIDNDTEVISDMWLENIFGMWGKDRYTSLMGPVWNYDSPLGRRDTPRGSMWTLPVSFHGTAFLVGKKVHGRIGFFSEDYGLYGEEDADYCLRCHHIGVRKYSFAAEPLMKIISGDEGEPAYSAGKAAAHAANIGTGEGEGIFALNVFLYEQRLRDVNVPLKYRVTSVRGRHVSLEEEPGYAPYRDKLMHCARIYNESGRSPTPGDIAAMRRILA
jgi:glycosyltransferase involved in cell wall biosynthesis